MTFRAKIDGSALAVSMDYEGKSTAITILDAHGIDKHELAEGVAAALWDKTGVDVGANGIRRIRALIASQRYIQNGIPIPKAASAKPKAPAKKK